jgi:hypothetical protein
MNKDRDSYKIERCVNFDDYSKEKIPRDVILGMVIELKSLAKRIENVEDITEDEVRNYLSERHCLKSETIENNKLEIDDAVDSLYPDEDQ